MIFILTATSTAIDTVLTPTSRRCAAGLKHADATAAADYVAAGILEPKVAEVKKRVRDKSRIEESEGGHDLLRDLAGGARHKQVARAEHTAAVAARKVARPEKRAEEDEAAAAKRAGLRTLPGRVPLWPHAMPTGQAQAR